MSVESDLYTALTTDAAVAALVGTRVYPVVAPDSATWPALVYTVVSQRVVGSGSTRCEDVRVQVRAYGPTYAVVKSLRDALVAFAVAQGYRYQVASDGREDVSELYFQSLDLFIL